MKLSEQHISTVVNETLGYLYKHQHKLPSDAESCNLWERLHTLIGCEECIQRHMQPVRTVTFTAFGTKETWFDITSIEYNLLDTDGYAELIMHNIFGKRSVRQTCIFDLQITTRLEYKA